MFLIKKMYLTRCNVFSPEAISTAPIISKIILSPLLMTVFYVDRLTFSNQKKKIAQSDNSHFIKTLSFNYEYWSIFNSMVRNSYHRVSLKSYAKEKTCWAWVSNCSLLQYFLAYSCLISAAPVIPKIISTNPLVTVILCWQNVDPSKNSTVRR